MPRALIADLSGATLTGDERIFLAEFDPLGVVLFRRNIENPEQLSDLIAEFRSCVGRDDAPVLIDQEGGRVARLREPHWWSGLPPARLGTAGPEAARLAARLLALDMNAVGIDVVCAPCLDLRIDGMHAVIGDRSFGADAGIVAACGAAFREGLEEGGVQPMIKHLPGHGRVGVDPHDASPSTDADLRTLREHDFRPFRALNDAPWGMTAHVVYKAIDPDPAGDPVARRDRRRRPRRHRLRRRADERRHRHERPFGRPRGADAAVPGGGLRRGHALQPAAPGPARRRRGGADARRRRAAARGSGRGEEAATVRRVRPGGRARALGRPGGGGLMGAAPDSLLYQISIWLLPVVTAITLHEAAHGWVAWKLGDDTARLAGRVTFNPLAHIDRFGTILLPGLLLLVGAPFLFGYAKPVPVDFRRLRRPKRDMVRVAAAGPGANLAMAFAAALLMNLTPLLPDAAALWVHRNLANALIVNVVLAVFNMLPLPPLDGGRVVAGLLPAALARPYARIERYGIPIVVALIALPPLIGAQFGVDLSVLRWILLPPVEYAIEAILALAGRGG